MGKGIINPDELTGKEKLKMMLSDSISDASGKKSEKKKTKKKKKKNKGGSYIDDRSRKAWPTIPLKGHLGQIYDVKCSQVLLRFLILELPSSSNFCNGGWPIGNFRQSGW